MDFLKALFDKILSIFPVIFLLTPYEAGIRVTFGNRVTPKGSGWYLIWPLFQRFIWLEVNSQIIDLRNQSIRTKDNKDIVVSGAIQYCIKDIQKAILNIQDVDKAITTLSLGIILEFVSVHSLEECSNKEELKKEILKGLRDASVGWGVKVERVYITDLGVTRNIRLLGNPGG